MAEQSDFVMTSIQEEIERINEAKSDLGDALRAKGATLTAGATLEEFTDAVNSLRIGDRTIITDDEATTANITLEANTAYIYSQPMTDVVISDFGTDVYNVAVSFTAGVDGCLTTPKYIDIISKNGKIEAGKEYIITVCDGSITVNERKANATLERRYAWVIDRMGVAEYEQYMGVTNTDLVLEYKADAYIGPDSDINNVYGTYDYDNSGLPRDNRVHVSGGHVATISGSGGYDDILDIDISGGVVDSIEYGSQNTHINMTGGTIGATHEFNGSVTIHDGVITNLTSYGSVQIYGGTVSSLSSFDIYGVSCVMYGGVLTSASIGTCWYETSSLLMSGGVIDLLYLGRGGILETDDWGDGTAIIMDSAKVNTVTIRGGGKLEVSKGGYVDTVRLDGYEESDVAKLVVEPGGVVRRVISNNENCTITNTGTILDYETESIAETVCKEELPESFNGFLTAKTVSNIAELNAIAPGLYAHVVVQNPAGDATVADTTRPALYKWDAAQSKYVYYMSASSGWMPGMDHNTMLSAERPLIDKVVGNDLYGTVAYLDENNTSIRLDGYYGHPISQIIITLASAAPDVSGDVYLLAGTRGGEAIFSVGPEPRTYTWTLATPMTGVIDIWRDHGEQDTLRDSVGDFITVYVLDLVVVYANADGISSTKQLAAAKPLYYPRFADATYTTVGYLDGTNSVNLYGFYSKPIKQMLLSVASANPEYTGDVELEFTYNGAGSITKIASTSVNGDLTLNDATAVGKNRVWSGNGGLYYGLVSPYEFSDFDGTTSAIAEDFGIPMGGAYGWRAGDGNLFVITDDENPPAHANYRSLDGTTELIQLITGEKRVIEVGDTVRTHTIAFNSDVCGNVKISRNISSNNDTLNDGTDSITCLMTDLVVLYASC